MQGRPVLFCSSTEILYATLSPVVKLAREIDKKGRALVPGVQPQQVCADMRLIRPGPRTSRFPAPSARLLADRASEQANRAKVWMLDTRQERKEVIWLQAWALMNRNNSKRMRRFRKSSNR
jgi:hypothetical protein